MKIIKTIIHIAFLIINNFSYSQEIPKPSIIDPNIFSTWCLIPEAPQYRTETDSSIIEYLIKSEFNRLIYRNSGIYSWNKFPNDKRRFEWLYKTIRFPPYYFKNLKVDAKNMCDNISKGTRIDSLVEVNLDPILKWDSIYPHLRREFLVSQTVSVEEKINFLFSELQSSMDRLRISPSKNLNSIYQILAEGIICLKQNFVNDQNIFDSYLFNFFLTTDLLFQRRDMFGLSKGGLYQLISLAKGSGIAELEKWYIQKKLLLGIEKEKFQLKFLSLDSRLIDLKRQLGNVILIDLWSTYCSSCISLMSTYKELYQKYSKSGFIVISICLNPETDIKIVKSIESKIDGKWPTLLAGGKSWGDSTSLYKELFEKYGLRGVPQVLLLNKQGEIVEYNNSLIYGDIESLIQNLLKDNK